MPLVQALDRADLAVPLSLARLPNSPSFPSGHRMLLDMGGKDAIPSGYTARGQE
ncbi:MAG TPA: hypothetical protein VK395_26620 [Gemmataceae bacterium]|nr:hypothetical protein [Gemmataceae bacterium]